VRHALASVIGQDTDDLEIIVSDNAETAPCRDVVDELADERVRYLRPDRPLAMHDNWEFGCEAATGDYVAVIIDKTVWLPSAARAALEAAERGSTAVVSWWSAVFDPLDETRDLTRGVYWPLSYEPTGPVEFDGREQLRRAISFAVPRGTEGGEYHRGKICFGIYRRDVLDTLRARAGRAFPPISPDYTSRILALSMAPSFLDLGVALQLSFVSQTSNGARVDSDPRWARHFLDAIDPELVGRLPIPGLFASQHNVVAHDYALAAEHADMRVPLEALCRRAREDLDQIRRWPNRRLRREQLQLLAAAERRAGLSRVDVHRKRVAEKAGPLATAAWETTYGNAYRALDRTPAIRIARKALRRPDPPADASLTLADRSTDLHTAIETADRDALRVLDAKAMT
jgi:glycosyltransferase involved in cell wall biosynthesis